MSKNLFKNFIDAAKDGNSTFHGCVQTLAILAVMGMIRNGEISRGDILGSIAGGIIIKVIFATKNLNRGRSDDHSPTNEI